VEEDAHVTTLAVDPNVRRRRLGTRLMLELVDIALERGAKHLTLEVRMSNASAQALYQRFGFAPVGLRKNYYRDEDALVMWAIDIDTDEYAERIIGIRRSLEAAA
jgi:ribosomal-protein-alanine N-acetyltransferase